MELDFLKWIEHAGFLIEVDGKNVYIDPFMVTANLPKADVIFITHSHFDHLSENDIKKLSTAKTQFVVPVEAAGKMSGRKLLAVEPGKSYEVDGIHFSTVPAYNVGREFHPKSTGGVGYIIEVDGMRIYHAGDTDLIDEMKGVDVDIALIPIGGHYTMDVEDAIKATKVIRAKVFAPIHYRALLGKEGSAKAEDEFRRRVKNSVILNQIQEPRYSLR
jgi:L-ascorbate metabolism protein UlaG (beta-lactamase superfamily)